MSGLAWLWRYSQGFRLTLSIRIVLGGIGVALGLLMVWLSKRFIDETIRTGSDEDIIRMIVYLVLSMLGGIVIRQICHYLTTLETVRAANRLRLMMFGLLFRRKLFDIEVLHSGDITSRFSKDIETISEVAIDTFPEMVVTTLQLVGAFLLLRMFDSRLAWILLLLSPIAMSFAKLISYRLKKMTLEIRKSESRIQMQVQEGVEYNAVLRSLGSEPWVTSQLDRGQGDLRQNVGHRAKFTLLTRLLFGCTFGLGYLIAFIWGGLGLRNGLITFGVMTSFLQLVGQIQRPVFSLLNMGPRVVQAMAGVERLQELEKECDGDLVASHENNSSVLEGKLGVRIENVSFGYVGERNEIISKFNYDFRPGSKVAIMGETGKGKTTLLRLLLGFIKPDCGRMLLYSESTNDGAMGGEVYALSEDLRGNFVYVPQGNTLMSGSIRYNLLLAKPDASESELQRLLTLACAEFVYDLPQGLDTELSERGGGLSEGQAQRLAIARGLLRPGNIMLFDEISSALDEETERELYRRLFTELRDKTMIIVTHRTAMLDLCDDVVRL